MVTFCECLYIFYSHTSCTNEVPSSRAEEELQIVAKEKDTFKDNLKNLVKNINDDIENAENLLKKAMLFQ